MKATIIRKIESDVIDVPSDMQIYYEAERPRMDVWMKEGSETTQSVTVKENAYQRFYVFDNTEQDSNTYFVKLDDRKIFNDLVKVSSYSVDEKVRKAEWAKTEMFLEEIPRIEANIKSSIKKLSWYRRLFNDF